MSDPLTAGRKILVDDEADTLDLHTDQIADLQAEASSHASRLEGLSSDIIARVGGKDGALNGYDGTINPTTTQVYDDTDTITGLTDSSGNLACLFSTAFPNGLVSIVVCNGDDDAAQFVASVKSPSASGFTAVCRQFDGTPVDSTNVRVNFTAKGW